MRKILTCLFYCFTAISLFGENRWKINESGSISWEAEQGIPHNDHIEMSGKQISAVIRYGVKADGSFHFERSLIWPMLRTIPNDTHASLMQRFGDDILGMLIIDNQKPSAEKTEAVFLDGLITVKSKIPGFELTRVLFPSMDKPLFCEKYVLKNTSGKQQTVSIPAYDRVYSTDPEKGVYGSYTLQVSVLNAGKHTVEPGKEITFSVFLQGYKNKAQITDLNIDREMKARQAFVADIQGKLVLETPDPVINTAFAFAKIRASESIFETKGGPMHAPGGESYYAAVWANDQAEYVNPFFALLGYDYGNKSAMNSFRHFARFINPEYKPIPSSIIAEGDSFWSAAGDRGDQAMVAYGAARYALARGNKKEAEELWPLIEWCLEYCHRKLNEAGVVTSDSDELERRFPAGTANLCTSSLYYDALISAVYLGKELGKPSKQINEYELQAKSLRSAIEHYFGATVEGFETYRYYEGNEILRSWICIPLTVGIFDRKQGTIDALFSPRLWSKDGLLTQAGSETFWDRSTLYALRGIFASGETKKGLEALEYYSKQRLLGEHVPYPIEAWPEGNQRHLSAESGLYCRIITEGIFGIRPTGLKSFTLTPQLPDGWEKMSLRKIRAFGKESIDILVSKDKKEIKIQVYSEGKLVKSHIGEKGQTLAVSLN